MAEKNPLTPEEVTELFSEIDASGVLDPTLAKKRTERMREKEAAAKRGDKAALAQLRSEDRASQTKQIDPLSEDDPSGSQVSHTITKTAMAVVIGILVLIVGMQIGYGVMRRLNTANLSESVSVDTVSTALKGGLEWGNGFTQFPLDFSVDEADERTGTVEVTVLDTSSANELELLSNGQIQAAALATNALLNDKIDRVVTNRILGLPIFVVIMFCVYYIAVSTLGGTVTDFTNDQLFGTDGWYVLGQGRDAYDAAVEAAGDDADSVDPAQYGPYVPGITTMVHDALVAGGTEDGGLVDSLVCDGIVGGLGAIFGFVPQMFLLFVMLSFLEDCGYMARVAFIMDRVFRRFGLSGKSFIPMLVSSGCGVPGVMATKTIENEKDRRMTVMTTTFIPCGAKLPIIALLMGSIIGDSSTTAAWISPLFYFLGVFAVIASGLMLKKTKLFAGRPTPFVMELPAYHFPAIRSWALHVWERCWAFIKKAGTVIFASTVVVWFLSNFGSYNGSFGFLPAMDGIPEEFMDYSVLAMLGNLVAWIFAPLGFSTWQATALTVSGLVAKENVVATAGSLLSVADAGETDPSLWTAFAGMFPTMGACVAFGAFNLLCAPCFAAIGTIRNQMDSGKWTAIAIGYECAFAWVIGLFINQFYNLLVLGQFGIWTIVAIVLLVAMLFQIFRPMPKHAWTDEDETNTASAAVSA